jgi:hypothetical protein
MRDEYPLRGGRFEVEARKGYLLMAVHGELDAVEDITHLGAVIERVMDRTAVRRILFDARGLLRELPQDACDAVWAWLGARTYFQMAVVLPGALATLGLARFNMMGLSSNLPLRAFATVMDAHRWLDMRVSGERRVSTQTMKAATVPPATGRSVPPPSDGAEKKQSGYFSSRPEPLPSQANGTNGEGEL